MIEPFCDFAELELAKEHYGHALMYLLHAKRLICKSSPLFIHITQTVNTLDFLLDEQMNVLYEMSNHDFGSCVLVKKNEPNKTILNFLIEGTQDVRIVSKQLKKPTSKEEQADEATADSKKSSKNTDMLEFLVDSSEGVIFGEPNGGNLNIFAELQENQNEIKQILKSVFNRETIKTQEKDSNKGDKKKERISNAPITIKKFMDLNNYDFKNDKKLTPIPVKELPQNKRNEYPSIYDRRIELYVKINFRILFVLLSQIQSNQSMFFNKKSLVFKMLDFCQKLCTEINIFFTFINCCCSSDHQTF